MSWPDDPNPAVGEPVAGWVPRERPSPGPLEGRHCSVVPLDPAHAEDLFATCAGPANESLWTYLLDGPFHDGRAFAAWVARMAEDPTSVSVAVCDPAGTPLGWANYLRIDPANGCIEVGNILLGQALQRTVAATEAMHLLAAHVFDDLGYRRYEWKLDALNAPSAAAARRLGFAHEGRFRNALVYKGRNRDTDWFAMTDADFARLRPAYDAWLDPANFDADGRQRRSLSDLTAATSASTVAE